MNCCDEYGNCNQGRDCPVRKTQTCKYCYGTGYDSSGQICVCQPDHFGDKLAGILCVFIGVMLLLLAAKSYYG